MKAPSKAKDQVKRISEGKVFWASKKAFTIRILGMFKEEKKNKQSSQKAVRWGGKVGDGF